jgi:hypothetical protein
LATEKSPKLAQVGLWDDLDKYRTMYDSLGEVLTTVAQVRATASDWSGYPFLHVFFFNNLVHV